MPGWANLTLVTDAELGQIEPQCRANQVPYPWGAITWPSQRAEAKRELKIWIELAFPEVVGAADRLLDRHAPDYAYALTGGSSDDVTNEVSDDEEEDLDLSTVFVTVADDRIYIGAAYQFEGLLALLKDSFNAVASTLTVKYSAGSGTGGWKALTVTDGTSSGNATFAQSGRITWTIPSDWQAIRWNGTADEYFWIELSVSAALTAGTALSQLLPIRPPDGIKRVAAYLALYFILNGLAQAAPDPESWQKKADAYWERAQKLFQDLKERGGIPLDRNRDQVVTEGELKTTSPVRIRRA